MKLQEFDTLLRQIESRYQGRQAALERSISRWIWLGFVVLISWVLFLALSASACLIIAFLVEGQLAIVLNAAGALLAIAVVWQAVDLLSVEPQTNDDYTVPRNATPQLNQMLDDLARDLLCPPIDEIHITLECNASVVEIPRMGLFKRPKTILSIGYPLAFAMSPAEFRAVMAHELLHISARHGKGSQRIYQLSRRWGNLFDRMQKPSSSSVSQYSRSATTRFINWFWPRLNARNLILSKMQEFQADLAAARASGATEFARSLWRLSTLDPWLDDRFWPSIHAQVAELPEPPSNIVSLLEQSLQTPPSPEHAQLWTERALARATLPDETHPALLDRVKAMGLDADDLRALGTPTAAQPSAVDAYLADLAPEIQTKLSQDWAKKNRGAWRDRYRRSLSRARQEILSASQTQVDTTPKPLDQPPQTQIDVHATWESACQVASLQGIAHAVPLLRQVLEADPSHNGASVVLGQHLASEGNPQGEQLLLQALENNDERWTPQAGMALLQHYRRNGQTQRLGPLQARLDQHQADLEASQRERAQINARDTLLPHNLNDSQLQTLRQTLQTQTNLASAWLVRKKIQYFTQRPMFVLCVQAQQTSRWFKDASKDQALVRSLVPRVHLPGQVLVIAPQGSFTSLARKCQKSPDSLIFPVHPATNPQPDDPPPQTA